MAATATVRVQIDEQLKDEATAIYAEIGLTLSEAFRLLLVRTVTDRKIPFEPFIPNAETIAAMKEAEHGELKRFASIEELMADLNAPD